MVLVVKDGLLNNSWVEPKSVNYKVKSTIESTIDYMKETFPTAKNF